MKPASPTIRSLPYRDDLSAADFQRLCNLPGPRFIWESSQHVRRGPHSLEHVRGRYSILGFNPSAWLICAAGRAKLFGSQKPNEFAEWRACKDPLEVLNQELSRRFAKSAEPHFTADPVELPFLGGAFGFLAYEAGRFFEPKLKLLPHSTEPDLFFLFVDKYVVLDHLKSQASLVVWETADNRPSAQLEQQISAQILAATSATLLEQPRSSSAVKLAEKFSVEEFALRVRRAQEYIAAGDAYQIVFSNTLSAAAEVEPFQAYDRLRQHNRSPFHFLLEFGQDSVLLGASPETMLVGGPDPEDNSRIRVAIRPVKGTYPRGKTPAEDQKLIEQLRSDPKELAEHLMLVDHERNDLGRVAEIGSVRVQGLNTVESYEHVHHLIAQVNAVLRPEENVITALRACFPIGTLCGTPRIRAMEIVVELEQEPRGIFGGAVALIGHNGTIDSCVAIRGAVVTPGQLTVKTGAGIVYDSIPEREYEECHWKARSTLEALLGEGVIK